MYKYAVIAFIAVIVAGFFLFGFPVSPESTQKDFAEKNPGASARCYDVGNTDRYIECMATQNTRLSGMDLVRTFADRLNNITYPFGYVFILSLILFLIVVCLVVFTLEA